MQQESEREANLCVLAARLEFTVEKYVYGEGRLPEVERTGELFRLMRTSDVSQSVCVDGLTLAQAEDFLRTWKLRGHGG
jgi:hypothetical protein